MPEGHRLQRPRNHIHANQFYSNLSYPYPSVQGALDPAATRFSGCVGGDASAGRRCGHYSGHHHRGDGGLRAGAQDRQGARGAQETGEALLVMFSVMV